MLLKYEQEVVNFMMEKVPGLKRVNYASNDNFLFIS